MAKNKFLMFVAAAGLSLAALPALADSIQFSFGTHDHGTRPHGRDHHERRNHHDFYERSHGRPHGFSYWNAPLFYEPRPVVYYREPVVVERRVIVTEPAQEPSIVATQGRIVSNSPYCREYQRNVTVGHRVEQSYGTACRQPDGAWKIVSE